MVVHQVWPVHWHDTLDSTNDEAGRLAASGECGPCWIAARHQTRGRGQRGADWIAPSGNLATTVLLPLSGPWVPNVVCIVAGLALIGALDVATGSGAARLKWPNDVRWQGRKLAGILVETGDIRPDRGQAERWAAVGFGVNIVEAPVTDQPTVCVQSMPGGEAASADSLLCLLDEHVQFRLEQMQSGQLPVLGRDWIARSETARLRLRMKTSPHRTGILTGMAEDGCLLLAPDRGPLICVSGGDVCLA